jgi:hypothetical protein
MTENRSTDNFWTTLPGILAGLTGLVVAIGGIYTAYLNSLTPPYKSHEHPFIKESSIEKLSQIEGNKYCKESFDKLKSTGDLGGKFNPSEVKHVWANISTGDCVANTPQ